MWMPGQPGIHDRIDDLSQREELRVRGSTGVQQKGPGGSEQEKHEGRLIADRHVLAQDVGVFVARVDLDVGIGVVLGGLRSVYPRDVKVQDGGTVGKGELALCCHIASSALERAGTT